MRCVQCNNEIHKALNLFQQTSEKWAGRKRAVVWVKSAEGPLILFTRTNDMLHNHLSDLMMQNLKRLFADLRFL